MSAVQINGQEVRHGDIVVLMASPDPGSFKNSTNTYSVVTYSDDAIGGHRHNFNEISRIALQALLSPHDAVGLATAVREHREVLEAADVVGIFALIFKPTAQAAAAPKIDPMDLADAIAFGTDGAQHYYPGHALAANHFVFHQDRVCNLAVAASRLSDLMTKRALKQ